ncbi:MAG TPA: HD domain-containing protein [Smithella sp.]|nr:HD domain-containing protein [Smithella sp.]MDM7987227.1 HD domain-containing protein [Smithella sp.]HNY49778.1 HD domain-containing protein [Smithella sp.]HOG90518.1 HD domain-containing protein [Smithella sp.]HOU50723.1 HD domain-containing protein [Smithella sp.]
MSEKKSIPERLGHDFLRALYHTINTVRMYQDNNQLVQNSVQAFTGLLNELTVSGDISLLLYRSRFHLGGEKIPYRRNAAVVIYNMMEFFSKRGIGSVTFSSASRDASQDNIIACMRLFNDALRYPNHLEWLEQKLQEHNISWVQIFPRQNEDETFNENLEEQKYEKARKNYFLAIESVREVANKVTQGMVGVRKTRRLAQNIVDMVQVDSALMIGMATIKDYDDYTYTHSVNVTLLATCLGRHIELSDLALEHLTICGLFHDLGKVDVPKEILFKNGELTNGEWDLIKAHPVTGVRKILMLNANPALRSRIILGPFEHHLNVDMTGYPHTMFTDNLSLIGKILHIADVYEAMTHERVYRTNYFTPDIVLKKMWEEAGKSFDRILLKRFIHMMGIYPIGSVVELSNGSIGLVMDYPDENERSQPLVLALVRDDQGNWQRGETIYLADQDIKEGSERLHITRVIPPAQLRVNPAEFFLHIK